MLSGISSIQAVLNNIRNFTPKQSLMLSENNFISKKYLMVSEILIKNPVLMLSEILIQIEPMLSLMVSEISFHAVFNTDKGFNLTVLNDTTNCVPSCT